MSLDIQGVASRCATLNVDSVGSGDLTPEKVAMFWKLLGDSMYNKIVGMGKSFLLQPLGRFSRYGDGSVAFQVNPTYARTYGLRVGEQPVGAHTIAPAVEPSPGILATKIGVSLNAGRTCLKEILEEVGRLSKAGKTIRLDLGPMGRLRIGSGTVVYHGGKTIKMATLRGGKSARLGGAASSRRDYRESPSLAKLAAASGGDAPAYSARPSARSHRGGGTSSRGIHRTIKDDGGFSVRGDGLSTARMGRSESESALVKAGNSMFGTKTISTHIEVPYRRIVKAGPPPESPSTLKALNDTLAIEKRLADQHGVDSLRDHERHELAKLRDAVESRERERIAEAAKMRAFADEQRALAEDRASREAKERNEDRTMVHDTRWVFTDNEEAARVAAENRRKYKEDLDEQVKIMSDSDLRRPATDKLQMTAVKGSDDLPAFLRPAQPIIIKRKPPAQAHSKVFDDAMKRHEESLQREAQREAKKAAEVDARTRKLEREYIQKKKDAKKLLQDRNKVLDKQVAAVKKKKVADREAKLSEPAPDHTHMHPVEAPEDKKAVSIAQEALRRALDEQVERRALRKQVDRTRQVSSDSKFMTALHDSMAKDRHTRHGRVGELKGQMFDVWAKQQELIKTTKKTLTEPLK